ncbi:phosphoribosylaminoimidazole-succinocarboxamide synthase [Calditerrivibrio nitroreducens DSM 19672]|uniref:Phosphoribosylaminoimidazole-succinocarboxamide synthase n=2 Tax=Calditerrivibrio nitroreducens TaxID=477976 RepID=E4TFP5_CALNY|nr:phosphoribosylaminoimidazolesuccinocarboxamide synthase [Calditerrivibrio nitroreducens]ADR18513.1 phosphoribosylaminoimidazole-succinocarboxamide synthase [Calditerrivibrio nitroreducens DSM 19672]
MQVILNTNLEGLKLIGRGKVRDIYDLGEYLLIVTTDRISAFDVIMPNGIPMKGYVLTQLSKFWFEQTKDIVENHLITTDIDQMPEEVRKHKDILKDRTMMVKKAKPYPIECVVRGYISGSGWKDYKATGTICGIKLREGMVESEKFDEPIFTPATKEELGKHDENISFERMCEIVGKEIAEKLKELTIKVYKRASEIAEKKGIIIADTKMEFGNYNGKIILIDEVLTPDSSRFWFKKLYQPGKPQESMDKQFLRNYLETLDWNKTAPGPDLPPHIIEQTSKRYLEIMEILTK